MPQPATRSQEAAGQNCSSTRSGHHQNGEPPPKHSHFLSLPLLTPSQIRTYINDPLPTFRTGRTNLEQQTAHNGKTSWLKSPFSALRRSYSASRERMIPLPALSSDPTSTVCTSAWAGTSQSRGSVDLTSTASNQDIIRVKQVISQESEGV